MGRKSNSENKITKAGNFPWRTMKKLGRSKESDENSKKSHKETVWQEKIKSTRIENRRKCVAGSQEYLFKLTLKEVRPKNIWFF